MINSGLFTSKDIRWITPMYLFDQYQKEFGIDLDTCAAPGDNRCPKYIAPPGTNSLEPVAEDGLTTDWALYCKTAAFMNPPYGRSIGKWTQKALLEAGKGLFPVICLLPSRTDTRAWHSGPQLILDGKIPGRIDFIKGRIHFYNANTGATGPAPFPSVVVIFGGT